MISLRPARHDQCANSSTDREQDGNRKGNEWQSTQGRKAGWLGGPYPINWRDVRIEEAPDDEIDLDSIEGTKQ
jgi:hypothetical protein